MMVRIAALALFFTGAVQAQLSLFTVSNAVETPAASPFNFGNVAQGDKASVRFRMRNPSAIASIQLVILGVSGSGFALSGAPPIPFVLAPGSAQDFAVVFTPGTASNYAGNLQLNSMSLILLASASPAPALTVLPSCTAGTASSGAAFSGTIDFGQVAAGASKICNFQLQNQSAASETISSFAVVGAGFQGPMGLAPPLMLSGQQTGNFSINFSAMQPAIYTGTLTIASRTYKLTATVFAPPLPAPILSFDTSLAQSGEQHTLSIRVPSAPALDASGNVNVTFVPDSPLISDDPGVIFAAKGTRSLPFSVKAGSTQVLIGGANGAVFQTGTSAGRIRFTISGVAQGISGDPTTELRIAPATVYVDPGGATFTSRLGNLDVMITGFDNTYTAGAMAFTFYDTSGNAIDPGTIQADFTSQFRSFFTASAAGSAFLVRVSFPVGGSQATIASVDATLVNSAGSATIRKLALQ